MCFRLLHAVRAAFARMHLFAAGTETMPLGTHPVQRPVGAVMDACNEGVALAGGCLMQSTDGFGLAPIRAHGAAGFIVIVGHTVPC